MKALKVVAAAAVMVACGVVANAEVEEALPLSEYVQDGLVVQWDGLHNAGVGVHDETAANWTELKSGLTVTMVKRTGNGFSWDENSFVEGSADSSCFWVEDAVFKDGINKGALTIEMFCLRTSDNLPKGHYEDWFGVGNSSDRRYLKLDIRTSDSQNPMIQGFQFRATKWNDQAAIPENSFFAWNKPQYVAVVCTNDAGTIKGLLYGNGDNLVHTMTGSADAQDGVFTVGGFSKNGGYPLYYAHIYAVRVYNRPLSPEELTANRLVDQARFEKKVSNWWIKEPTISVASWDIRGTPGTLDFGDAVYGEVSCNYTQEEIDALPVGQYDLVFTVPDDGTHVGLTKRYKVSVVQNISATEYVQDGLIAQWDGLENAGYGVHDSAAATWTDLKGHVTTKVNNLGSGGTWANNAFVNGQSNGSCFWTEDAAFKTGINATGGTNLTVEIFANHHSSSTQTYEDWLGVGNGGSARWMKLDIRTKDSESQVFQGLQYRATKYNGQAAIPANSVFAWGKPQYAAVICTGGTAKLYGNGTNLVHTITGSSAATDGVFTFGGFAKNDGYPLRSASIHTVRAYSRQLSPEELAYNAALDKLRFTGDATDYNKIMFDADVSSVLDVASGQIVVSALVRGMHAKVVAPKLEAVSRRSDGLVVRKTLAETAAVSATPYTSAFGDLVGESGYELSVVMTDDAGHEITYSAGNVVVGEVLIAAGDDLDLATGGTGSFVVTRGTSLEATANELVVNYTVGGTAAAGREFEALSGAVTIPVGESSAVIPVKQIPNPAQASDLTLTLTLATGGYVPKSGASSATIRVVKPDFDQPWTYANGTLTDGIWHFQASCSGTSITVGRLTATYSFGLLDLSKPVADDLKITAVGNYVLQNNTVIRELRLPDTLTSLGDYCFSGCSSLTNFTPALPAKLTTLGQYAFQGCGKLTGDIVIGRGVESCQVGGRAFQSSGITSVRFAGSVKTVPECCFEWCYNLTNAVLEEGVQTVNLGAFQSSALTHVRLPEKSLTTLKSGCFRTTYSGDARCGKLASVEPFLPKSITTLGDRVFCLSFATAVEPSMDELVLQNRKADITLAEGWQFEGASATKKVTLGRGITKLPNGFLQSMKSVNELRFGCPYPPYTGTPFLYWSARQACVYVPAEEKGWMDFLTNTTYVTPWKGTDDVPGVSDALKSEFATKFPGLPHPFGLTTTSAMFGSQWIYKVNPPGTKIVFR